MTEPRRGAVGSDNIFDLPLALPARALWAALALALAVLFISDLRAPLGALDAVPFVVAVLLSLALPRGWEPIVVAAACTAITLITGFFARSGPGAPGFSILHTGLPIFIVWVTAWLARRYRRAGLAMRAADERLQLAAHSAGLGTYEYGVTTDRNEWSPSAKRIAGIPLNEAVTMARLASMTHPDDAERVRAAIQASLDPGGSGEFADEHRLIRADGSILWVLVKGRTFFQGTGQQRRAVAATGVIIDVTERRNTEQALRESEERLRLATEAAGIGTFDLDLIARRARYSPRLLEIAGLPPDTETSLDRFIEFLHPDDRDRAIELFTAASGPDADGGVSSELRIITTDGNVVWVSWSGRIFMGRTPQGRVPVRAIGVATDVTASKRSADALAEREALYRTLTEAMPHLVFTTTPGGTVDYVNWQWREYLGAAIVEGMGLDEMPCVHPDDVARARQAWKRSLATGEPFRCECRLRRVDGEYRWHQSRALPVRHEGRGIARWIGTCTDVHDATVATAALRDADRRKDEFLATLAHELRNPLSPMRIAVSLLGRRQEQDAEIVRLRDVIGRQVDQLTRLVEDLLDVSRITRDRLELRREHVDLRTVISDAIETIRPEIERQDHHLVVTLPDAPMTVDGDVVRMTQVFSNLLSNAAKYTPPQGSIAVNAQAVDGTAVITIADSGIGIAPDKLPRLFEMFYQGDTSLDRPDAGLGIGLTLVRKLMDMHGGSVEGHSDGPGHGSRFTVHMPLIPTEPQVERERAVVAETPTGPPMRVLVVDDNRDSADMLRVLLELCGHSVVTAYDGDEALTLAEDVRPDAVLLDIGLPRMNGYEVCRRLRTQPWGEDVLIIAQTGWGQEQDLLLSREAGFDAHLTKPIDDDEVLALLAKGRAGLVDTADHGGQAGDLAPELGS